MERGSASHQLFEVEEGPSVWHLLPDLADRLPRVLPRGALAVAALDVDDDVLDHRLLLQHCQPAGCDVRRMS